MCDKIAMLSNTAMMSWTSLLSQWKSAGKLVDAWHFQPREGRSKNEHCAMDMYVYVGWLNFLLGLP